MYLRSAYKSKTLMSCRLVEDLRRGFGFEGLLPTPQADKTSSTFGCGRSRDAPQPSTPSTCDPTLDRATIGTTYRAWQEI